MKTKNRPKFRTATKIACAVIAVVLLIIISISIVPNIIWLFKINNDIENLWEWADVIDINTAGGRIQAMHDLLTNNCQEYNDAFLQQVRDVNAPYANNYTGEYRSYMSIDVFTDCIYIGSYSKEPRTDVEFANVTIIASVAIKDDMLQGVLSINPEIVCYDFYEQISQDLREPLEYPFFRIIKDGMAITYIQDRDGQWYRGPSRIWSGSNPGYDIVGMLDNISLDGAFPPSKIENDRFAATIDLSCYNALSEYGQFIEHKGSDKGAIFVNKDKTLNQISILGGRPNLDAMRHWWEQYGDTTYHKAKDDFNINLSSGTMILVTSVGDAAVDRELFDNIVATDALSFDFIYEDLKERLLQLREAHTEINKQALGEEVYQSIIDGTYVKED